MLRIDRRSPTVVEMKQFATWVGLLLATAMVGCNPSGTGISSGPTGSPAPANAPSPIGNASTSGEVQATASATHYYLDQPQTNLMRVKLMIGPTETLSEVCLTVSEVSTGLMHRKSIGPEETMFFAFGEGQPRAFYMKNVPFDIAAAYIDSDGVLQEVVTLKAMDETPVVSKSTDIQYVLEAAPDWFSRHGIMSGALVRAEKGPLGKAFAGLARLR